MGIHLWISSNFVAVCLFLFQWSSRFFPQFHLQLKSINGIDINQRLNIVIDFQSARCRFFSRVSEWVREKREKNPSEWKFKKENYKCATNQVVCSCRLLQRNFAINAQLAHMCNIFWYTIHSHTHTLNIQTSILAINFQSLKSAVWLIKWLGFRIFVLII